MFYKITFWSGYAAMLILAVLPSGGNLSDKHIGLFRLDYLAHFGVYLAICLYFVVGKRIGFELFRRKATLKFIVAIIILATVTELLQLAVPYRAFNPLDLVANLAGVAFCLLACLPCLARG